MHETQCAMCHSSRNENITSAGELAILNALADLACHLLEVDVLLVRGPQKDDDVNAYTNPAFYTDSKTKGWFAACVLVGVGLARTCMQAEFPLQQHYISRCPAVWYRSPTSALPVGDKPKSRSCICRMICTRHAVSGSCIQNVPDIAQG